MNEIFVKIEEFKELTDILSKVDEKLRESSAMLEHLEKLKAEEDEQIKAWSSQLQSMQTRAQTLHHTLTQRG